MSKSFSVDLNDHHLYRAIGSGKEPLKQRVDRGDLVGLLYSLGYNNINERGLPRSRWGTLGSLEEVVTSWVIGVPSSAVVSIRVIGKSSNNVLVNFTY